MFGGWFRSSGIWDDGYCCSWEQSHNICVQWYALPFVKVSKHSHKLYRDCVSPLPPWWVPLRFLSRELLDHVDLWVCGALCKSFYLWHDFLFLTIHLLNHSYISTHYLQLAFPRFLSLEAKWFFFFFKKKKTSIHQILNSSQACTYVNIVIPLPRFYIKSIEFLTNQLVLDWISRVLYCCQSKLISPSWGHPTATWSWMKTIAQRPRATRLWYSFWHSTWWL